MNTIPGEQPRSSDARYGVDHLLTIEVLAEKLHIAVKTVYAWVAQKRIPFTRLGRRLYFSELAIEALLSANEAPARSQGNRQGFRLRKGGQNKGAEDE